MRSTAVLQPQPIDQVLQKAFFRLQSFSSNQINRSEQRPTEARPGLIPGEGRTREDPMSEDGVDFRGPGLQQLLGGVADGAAGVGHVVNLVLKS